MFPGTETKEFDCPRCRRKDARRKFLDGEGGGYPGESDSLWPARDEFGYMVDEGAKGMFLAAGRESNRVRWSPAAETWTETRHTCKKCLHHHKAFSRKMEPLFERGAVGERWCAPAKTGRASGRNRQTQTETPREAGSSVSPTGGRNVLSPSERLADKEKEENLSLRFWDNPLTDCKTCLHHHGRGGADDGHRRDPSLGPAPLGPDEEPFSQADLIRFNENGGAWWAKSEEEAGCARCLAHHWRHEGFPIPWRAAKKIQNSWGRLEDEKEAKDGKQFQGLRPMVLANASAPGPVGTPGAREREPWRSTRSRTPTPGRSNSYRELHQRKEGSPPREQLLWTSMKLAEGGHDFAGQRSPSRRAEGECSKTASPIWTTRDQYAKERKRRVEFCERDENFRTYPPLRRDEFERISDSRSPRWSKECLHMREMASRARRGSILLSPKSPVWSELCQHSRGMTSPGRRGAIVVYSRSPRWSQECLHTRELASRKRRGEIIAPSGNVRMIGGSANEKALAESMSKLASYSRVASSRSICTAARGATSRPGDESNIALTERGESRWAPPPTWTVRQLNEKEQKKRTAYNKKVSKSDRELVTAKEESHHRKFEGLSSGNSRGKYMDFKPGELSRVASSPHVNKMEICDGVFRFEVVNVNEARGDESLRERKWNSDTNLRSPSVDKSRYSSPVSRFDSPAVRVDRRDPKPDNFKTAENNSVRSSTASRKRNMSEKDIKLSLAIRSEVPLDAVDGRLKQFLKGMGGLVYYSRKDGGIPRIRELANYFSGKQPLLWFFPR